MRRLSYKVMRADGTEFYTTSYAKATEGCNRITDTILTPIDPRTEKEKELAKKHREKINQTFSAKHDITTKKTDF